MSKNLFKRSMAVLLSLAMLLAYAPGLTYLGIESSKSSVYAEDKDWTYTGGSGVLIAYKATGDANVNAIRFSAKNVAYTGQPYAGLSIDKTEWTDDTLISPWVEYSSNGTTWNETAPTDAGSYYARFNNSIKTSDNVAFQITAKDPKATLPTAKTGLEYNGKTQVLINAGTVEGGHFEYTVNGTSVGETIPTGVEAGTYTITYESVYGSANYKTVTGSVTVTIDEPIVPAKWTFAGNKNIIKATETGTEFGLANQYLTLYAPDMMFNGQAYDKASVKLSSGWIVNNNLETVSVSDITYYEYSDIHPNSITTQGIDVKGEKLNAAPTEVGKYVAVITVEDEEAFQVFNITKSNPSVKSLPTAVTGLVYNGKEQVLVNAGEVEGGHFVYSLTGADAADFSESLPTATAANDYVVYYKSVTTDGYNVVAGSVKVTIDKKLAPATWRFHNTLGSIIVAEEYDTDYGYADQYLTLSAKDKVYDGKQYDQASITLSSGWTVENGLEPVSTDDILYFTYNERGVDGVVLPIGKEVNGAPTAVGKYVAVAYLPEGLGMTATLVTQSFAYKVFEILPGQSAVKALPTAKTGLIYNDEPQVLFNAGEATNGTMKYCVSNKELNRTELEAATWNSNPSASANMMEEVGTYYVYYYVDADDDYYDCEYDVENFFTVTISRGKSAVKTAPTAVKNLEYTGEEQEIIDAGSASNGTMMYYVIKKGEATPTIGDWTGWYRNVSSIQQVEAGTYRVYYAVKGVDGYADYFDSEDYIEVKIAQKVVRIIWDETSFVYNGKLQLPTAHVENSDLVYKDQVEYENVATAVVKENFARKDVNKKTVDGTILMYEAKATAVQFGDVVNNNYKIDTDTIVAKWQITPRHITLRVKPNLGKTYGDSGVEEVSTGDVVSKDVYDPYWYYGKDAAEYVSQGYVIVDNSKEKIPEEQLKEELSSCIEMDREAGENVGTYAVTIDASGMSSLDNYVLDKVENGTYTISKRDILVVADAKSKIYGEKDPLLTYRTYGPFINFDGRKDPAAWNGFVTNVTYTRQRPGEFEEVVKINDNIWNSFTGNINRVEGEDVDSYAIKRNTLDSANYNIIFVQNPLVINQREVYPNQLVWGQKSFKYDGHKHVRTAKLVERDDAAKTGLAKRDEAFFLNVTGEEREVGTNYVATAVMNNDNYKLVDGEDYTEKFHIVPNTLVAKGTPSGSNKAKISWDTVSGANYYAIYGAKCGKSFQYIGKTMSTSFTAKKIGKTKVKANTAYKFYVVAYNVYNEKIAQSNAAHVITNKVSGKKSNVTSIKATAANCTLEVGNYTWIGATQKTYKNKAWLGTNHSAKFRYVSSDTSVATVDAYGNVYAVEEGTCTIYVQAINGMWSTVTIAVVPAL